MKRRIYSIGFVIIMMISAICINNTIKAKEHVNGITYPSRVSVHDPSIIKAEGKYYVFGSHMADAKSSNLIDWSQINVDWNARETKDAWKQDSIYGDVLKNYAKSFEWAGYDDGDCSNDGLALWAPDVIYNPYYKWKDGSTGAYMLYYSASSTWRRSCIGYAVAKEIEGPYNYVDTVIYSGFSNKAGMIDGNSIRDTYWNNDYLNIKKLIKNKMLPCVSDNWFSSDGGYNTTYGPNAIDPTLFFDKENNLYMVYGSWSGGLFIHQLNRETGSIKYPGKDGIEETSGNAVDRYFGTRIAGGNGSSGEGSYILYDSQSDYYYMYESYGGLTATGGYNMRLFRSKNVYGPYLDAAGRNAKDSKTNGNQYGIKLIGNYKFTGQPGYRAAGHNSALIDDDGSHYLVYHQRFEGKSNHQVRIRQQFLNEDNWPVSAVYEYRGEKPEHCSNENIVGSYEIINHGTNTDGKMLSSQKIELCENGTIQGDKTGTWCKTTDKNLSYDYATLIIDGVTYKGFFFEQYNEKDRPEKVMTFSAIGDNNTSLWGTHRTKEEIEADKIKGIEVTPTPLPTVEPMVTEETKSNDKPILFSKNVKLKRPAIRVKVAKKRVIISWKKVSGANGYQLWFARNKQFTKGKKIITCSAKVTKKTIKNLKKKKWYFKLQAYKIQNGKKVLGPFSKIQSKKV